jgi:hypothetical protein
VKNLGILAALWSPAAALLAGLAAIGMLVLLAAPGHGLLVQSGGSTGAGTGPAPTATAALVHVTIGDPAMAFGSVGQLKQASEVVVLGTVTGVAKVQYVAAGDEVWTTWTVRADEVLGGAQQHARVAAAQQITVFQMGGSVDGHQTNARDDPQMVVGMRAFMFLRWAAADASLPAGYVFVGDAQGRFVIANGVVRQAYPFAAVVDAKNAPTEANFRATIARA